MIDSQEIRDWVIYKITSPTGRVYIGKTTNYNKRKQSYSGVKKGQSLIYSSIKKYGYENHKFEIIDQFKGTISYSDDKEMFWIRSFMSNRKRWEFSEYKYVNGLNCTDGGGGMIGNHSPKYALRGRPLKEETKRKLSEAKKELYRNGFKNPNLGKKLSEERKKQIGASKVGNKYNVGRKRSEEAKENSALAKLKKSKAILQYDLQGNLIAEFRSARLAERKTGISRNVINLSAKGLLKRLDKRRKYIFKYKEQ